MSLRNALLVAAAAAVLAVPAFGSARLTYFNNGTLIPVSWSETALPIRYSIDRRVASSIPQITSLLDRAIRDWTSVPGADVRFQSLGVGDVQSGEDGRNTITIADDLFANQKYIALTTNWYSRDGHIIESDMQIDPSAVTGGFNLQQLVEHEMGHLLGLDHSAVLSSVMYPYVGTGPATGLDSDDRVAIAAAYAAQKPGATIAGRVYGDSGGIFAAQVVAVNEDGEPVSTALSDQSGAFTMEGVPAGTYRIYAEPLDGPVNVQNLSGFWQTAKVTSFPTQFADGGAIRVESGRIYGNVTVNGSGVVRLNPRWVGSCAAGSDSMALQAMPATLHPGATVSLGVGGDGFTSGMTTFDVPNPGFHRISDYKWFGNYVTATYQLDPGTSPGSVVVLVKSGNESAALTGALRVEGALRSRSVRK